MVRFAQLPPSALQAMRESSILMRATTDAADSVLPGIATYLFKLGPANLGDGYASDLDRAIAAGITPLSMRLRLRHMARALADGLAPMLSSRPGPLQIVNIAGGPAGDALNALILLWKERRELLCRPVSIHVLDTDAAGPGFGARALEALRGAGAPLEGLNATLLHVPYDWPKPRRCGASCDRWPIPARSSPGPRRAGCSSIQMMARWSITCRCCATVRRRTSSSSAPCCGT
jgi:hypothetical protein